MKLGLKKRLITKKKKRKEIDVFLPPDETIGTPESVAETLGLEIQEDMQKEFEKAAEEVGLSLTKYERNLLESKAYQRRKLLPELEITDISYTIFSDEEIKNLAVYVVRKDSEADLEGIGGVNDPRGGTVDNKDPCVTCQKDNLACPGHYGMIPLNEHIIHPLFRREVIDILSSVCGSCGGLLVPVETLQEKGILALTGSKRLRAIADISKGVPCRRRSDEGEEDISMCIPNPIYKTDKIKESGKIFYTTDAKSKAVDNIKPVEEVDQILSSISERDAQVLGFSGESHPSRFIMKSLLVIPICARAPVFQDGEKMKDDLTSMYLDIARLNNELAKTDLKEQDRKKKIEDLNHKISHLMNNSDQKYSQGSKKAYQSLKERIQGKEALIRNALMGKRVNYSARTVLGPDPTLKFGQIRVPEVMAPFLTQHEIVTPQNLRKMTSLLRNGKITRIKPSTGKREGKPFKVNDKIRDTEVLVIGDEVDRWLMNGDYVVFNRQPTLQKQGMMGYEVVLGKPLTFGLHLGYTKQHNAD